MNGLREGIEARRQMISDNIMKSMTNKEEVFKTEEQENFEKSIKTGGVEVITMDDVNESYGGKYFQKSDVDKVNAQIDELIVKGETDNISEEEYNFIEGNLEASKELVLKALVIPQAGEGQKYIPVYVAPITASEEE